MEEISGFYAYKGTTTLQHKDIGIKLKKLFNETTPLQILEIGTAYGGLTLLIWDILVELSLHDSKIRSYDISDANRPELDTAISNGANIEFINKNLFHNHYSELVEEEINNLKDYIQQTGTTIVMCDGGYKINEFRFLSQFLKPEDIIMAHDYSSSVEYYEEFIHHKIWDWHEIHDSDIEDAVIKYNLQPYMRDEFQEVVWVCKIKN